MFNPWVEKMPWRRKRQPTSVFLPGESPGQRSLVGYSPWSRKESDTSYQLNHHLQFLSHATKKEEAKSAPIRVE